MPELSGHYHTGWRLLLVKLQRQAIRVIEKGKSLIGKRVDSDGFALDAVRFKMLDGQVEIVHAKRKMAKSTGFWP